MPTGVLADLFFINTFDLYATHFRNSRRKHTAATSLSKKKDRHTALPLAQTIEDICPDYRGHLPR